MRDIDLFQLALALVPPWMVAIADFDVEKKRLDIEIDFKTGGRFPIWVGQRRICCGYRCHRLWILW